MSDNYTILVEMAKRALPLESLSTDQYHTSVVYGLNEDGTGIAFDDPGIADFVVKACNYFRETKNIHEQILNKLLLETSVSQECLLEAQAGDAIEFGELSERARIHSLILVALNTAKQPPSPSDKTT